MNWKYNSVLDHEAYKKELDKLNDIKGEIEAIQHDTIPKLEAKAEKLKKESLKSDKVTWQDVEQVKHEIEKSEYRIKVLKAKRDEQQEITNKYKQEAQEIIIQEAEKKKIETLEKSLQAYELLEQAYNDNQEIDRYQQKALQLAGRDFTRKKAKIPVDFPNPTVQNVVWDIWLKKAYKFLESKGIKKSS